MLILVDIIGEIHQIDKMHKLNDEKNMLAQITQNKMAPK